MKWLFFLLILVISSCSTLEDDIESDLHNKVIGTWALTSHSFVGEVVDYDTISFIYKITDDMIITYDNRTGEFSNDDKVPDTSIYTWEHGTMNFDKRQLKAERYGNELTLTEVGNVGGIAGSISTFLPYNWSLPPSSWVRSAGSPTE